METVVETMPETVDPREQWETAFEQQEVGLKAGFPEWLFPLRKAAMARFDEIGFPTSSDEDWRFTNVKAIAALPPVFSQQAANVEGIELPAGHPLLKLDCDLVVFRDGVLQIELSSAIQDGDGIFVGSLVQAFAHPTLGPLFESRFAGQREVEENGFEALNTAFAREGLAIYLGANRRLKKPIHIVYLSEGKEPVETRFIRNLIIGEANSEAVLLESYLGGGAGAYANNVVSEFGLGDQARWEHCRFQDELKTSYHLSTLHLRMGRGAHLASHSFALGAALSRSNIRLKLNGQDGEGILNGLYLTDDNRVADHHMIVDHAKPHCLSHEYFNGILDGTSKGIFHGRIHVRQEAQKTDAKQTNRNLLLTDQATADAKPQLEIYADDVKCTHGATVGQMDEDAIFYLRARGIALEEAKRILMHAFASEIVDRVQWEPLRDRLNELVWTRLEK